MRNRSNGSSLTPFVIAVHPSNGGIAPAIPPMTIFCEVRFLNKQSK